MQYLAIFLVVYGVFVLLGWFLKFPFLYNNMKSKTMIKMMGKKGFDIMLVIVGIATLVIGIILLN